MRIEITVVKKDQELLFSTTSGVRFDCLHAWYEFGGGTLFVYRGGQLFDQTTTIMEVGTHAACICFCGLKELFQSGDSRSWAISALVPEDLQPGDIIIIDTLALPADFDFDNFIYTMWRGMSTMEQIFDEHGGSVKLDDLQKDMDTRMRQPPATKPDVLRFIDRRADRVNKVDNT